jgi:hypothetical protein
MEPGSGTMVILYFLVMLTTEIDGAVYFLKNEVKRGTGHLRLELLNDQHTRLCMKQQAAGMAFISCLKW